jgi:adenosylcobinamide amidohydrolase
MNVKQLIEKLSLEDPEKRIVVAGYEGGFDEFDSIGYVRIKPDLNKKNKDLWYLGEFKECLKESNTDEEIAILLPRKS